MARLLSRLQQTPLSTTQAGLAAMTLLLCAFALLSMCASHSRRKWGRWSTCYGFRNHHDPVIQLNTEDVMMRVEVHGIVQGNSQDEGMFSGEQGGVPVWQKNILMGDKCKLPDFSGVIIYNSEGQVVNPAKNPRPLLTWK